MNDRAIENRGKSTYLFHCQESRQRLSYLRNGVAGDFTQPCACMRIPFGVDGYAHA